MGKILWIILLATILSGCATLTKEQKDKIAEYRACEIIDNHPNVFIGNKEKQDEIKNQYK